MKKTEKERLYSHFLFSTGHIFTTVLGKLKKKKDRQLKKNVMLELKYYLRDRVENVKRIRTVSPISRG